MKKLPNPVFSLITILFTFSTCMFTISACAQDSGWTDLFNGKDLTGWEVHSGTAKYRVEDGQIIGTAVPNSPNTFLCTRQEYGDFILEFEVFLDDPELNSGVQFRSRIAPAERVFVFRNERGEYRETTIPADRVYGYQVEIATGGAGGVYDEARRAMIRDWWPDGGSSVFKLDQWNHYRVECKGDSIRTLVNGTMVADFRDALTESGIIGLQVHDVGDNPTPFQVRWRNIRIKELD